MAVDLLDPQRATVAGLLGGWPHAYRVLHPVEDWSPQQGLTTMRWSEIAGRRGQPFDPATASWLAVSGRRLHQTAPDGRDVEPPVGPVAGVLIPLLDVIASEFDTAEVLVGEWTGYGSATAGRNLHGARREADRVLGATTFGFWRLPLSTLVSAIAAGSETTTMGPDAVLANWIEDPLGQWVVRADGDLASTYVGTSSALPDWPTVLEWTSVGSDAPLS